MMMIHDEKKTMEKMGFAEKQVAKRGGVFCKFLEIEGLFCRGKEKKKLVGLELREP